MNRSASASAYGDHTRTRTASRGRTPRPARTRPPPGDLPALPLEGLAQLHGPMERARDELAGPPVRAPEPRDVPPNADPGARPAPQIPCEPLRRPEFRVSCPHGPARPPSDCLSAAPGRRSGRDLSNIPCSRVLRRVGAEPPRRVRHPGGRLLLAVRRGRHLARDLRSPVLVVRRDRVPGPDRPTSIGDAVLTAGVLTLRTVVALPRTARSSTSCSRCSPTSWSASTFLFSSADRPSRRCPAGRRLLPAHRRAERPAGDAAAVPSADPAVGGRPPGEGVGDVHSFCRASRWDVRAGEEHRHTGRPTRAASGSPSWPRPRSPGARGCSRPDRDTPAHGPLRLPPPPADVRAQPGAPAAPADRAPRRRRRSGPSATTATPGSPTAATRPASWSTSSPTRSPRARTPWSRSAATSPTTPARWPRSPRTSGWSACWCRRTGSRTGPTR